MAEKIIRDPVHDVISFRNDRVVDRLLFDLLNCAEFQRLRRIRQLGFASLAYPGADHSRYSHSLGVMETARKILEQLRRSMTIDEEQEITCLAAALLHDLGHGPFSHVFERVSGIDHEEFTGRVIQDPDSEVYRLLAQTDRELPGKVMDLLHGRPASNYLSDILSSQLDADRLDYLLRDNYMTGSRYGDFDIQWLLRNFVVDPASQRLAVTYKGVSAVEGYLQARYHMYRNVYFHKVVRAGEGMLKLALQRAKRLAVQDRLEWPPRDQSVYKALLGQQLTIAEFTDLDDVSVLHCFKLWTNAEDPVLAGLCKGLLFRKLFKTIDLSAIDDTAKIQRAVESAGDAVTAAGGDPLYDLFYDEPADTPYEVYQPDDPTAAKEILVLDRAGKLTPFTTISPFVQSLNQQLMFRRIHVHAQYRDAVAQALRNCL